MAVGLCQEVKVAGQLLGYEEYVRLWELWKAVPNGMPPYPSPIFGLKGYALEFVRKYGRAMRQA